MKLNLGCGLNKLDGWVNVDASPACAPDEVVDLEQTPWPWASDSVDEVRFIHSLEHMGQQTSVFLGVIKELYRVCQDGARITIHAPHPRHDDFLNDPTHVRPITAEAMELFDRAFVLEVQRQGGANTPLSLYLDVDLAMTKRFMKLDQPYAGQLDRRELPQGEALRLIRSQWNVVKEVRLELTAHKPPRT